MKGCVDMRLAGVFTTMIGSRSWFERSYSLVALTCQSFESRDTSVILSASIASSPKSVLNLVELRLEPGCLPLLKACCSKF